MLEEITVIVVFVIIALIWAGIFTGAIRKLSPREWEFLPNRKYIGLTLMGLIALGVAFYGGLVMYEWSESPDFCADTCHSMLPYYETYLSSGNNTIMQTHRESEIICADCHNGPGIVGTLETRIGGSRMLINEMTGNYDPDHIKGEVPNRYCEKGPCHDTVDWQFQGEVGPKWHPFTDNGTTSPVTGSSCVTCHNPRMGAIGLTKASCLVCHEMPAEYLYNHENRTCGSETCHLIDREVGHRPVNDPCMHCHNRLHPDDARVPYSVVDDYEREGIHIELTVDKEFCGDCHPVQYAAYTTFATPETQEFYGSCVDCHAEHKNWTIPHILPTEQYNDCKACHKTFTDEIFTHNPTEISFDGAPFVYDIPNEFCESCHIHQDKIDELAGGRHAFQSCVNCHQGHKVVTVTSSDCLGCHDATSGVPVPDWHEDDYNCAGCHNAHDPHQLTLPHDLPTEDYRDCSECHATFPATDPSTVDFKDASFADTIPSTFCAGCHTTTSHQDKLDLLSQGSHAFQNCVNCHAEHRTVTITSQDCLGCHDKNSTVRPVPDWHQDDFTCINCHDPHRPSGSGT